MSSLDTLQRVLSHLLGLHALNIGCQGGESVGLVLTDHDRLHLAAGILLFPLHDYRSAAAGRGALERAGRSRAQLLSAATQDLLGGRRADEAGGDGAEVSLGFSFPLLAIPSFSGALSVVRHDLLVCSAV